MIQSKVDTEVDRNNSINLSNVEQVYGVKENELVIEDQVEEKWTFRRFQIKEIITSAVLLGLYAFIMFIPVFLLQLLTFSIAFSLYIVAISILYFYGRFIHGGYSRPAKGIALVYFTLTSIMIFSMAICSFSPFYRASAANDKSTVVLGDVTNSSIKVLAHLEGTNSYKVRYHVSDNKFLESETVLNGNAVQISELEENVTYPYDLINPDTNSSQISGSFRTLPSDVIRFVSTSCTMKHQMIFSQTIKGFSKMSLYRPNFHLYLGDFVYVDTPFGFGYSGVGYGSQDTLYNGDYIDTLTDPAASSFLKSIPGYFMIDDHEITNDYGEGNSTVIFQHSLSAFNRFLGNVNPTGKYDRKNGQYFTFSAGNAEFFYMDSRSNRVMQYGVILGEQQMNDIKSWLIKTQAKKPKAFKFLVSPVGFSRDNKDPIGNYNCRCPKCDPMSAENKDICPDERDKLMQFIVENKIQRLSFISGDTHTPAVIELHPSSDREERVLEFSASPLLGISDVFYGDGPDKILFENPNYNEAWMVVDVGQNYFEASIYGGSNGHLYFALAFMWVCICVFLVVGSFVYAQLWKQRETRISILYRIFLPIFIVAIISSCSLYIWSPDFEKNFNEPVFKYRSDSLF